VNAEPTAGSSNFTRILPHFSHELSGNSEQVAGFGAAKIALLQEEEAAGEDRFVDPLVIDGIGTIDLVAGGFAPAERACDEGPKLGELR
jgi:hypothetical protein